MKRRGVLVAALVMLVGLGVIAGVTGVVLAQQAGNGPPPAPTVKAPAPGPQGVAYPTLNPTQEERAKSIFAQDSKTQSLLGKPQYTITRVGPWIDSGESVQLLGALMQISFSAPIDVEGEWPAVEFPEPRTASPLPYRQIALRQSVGGLRVIHALVDLSLGQVVELRHWDYAQRTILEMPPGYPKPPPPGSPGGR